MISATGDARLKARADEILHQRERHIYRRIDRMFAVLMVVQWIGAVATALCISPRTWSGATSSLHPHVWFAFCVGGALASRASSVEIGTCDGSAIGSTVRSSVAEAATVEGVML